MPRREDRTPRWTPRPGGGGRRRMTAALALLMALLVGAYICDLVVSGPDTSLLADSEKASILDFVKSTALMIFSYFFGVKSAGTPKED